MYNAYKIKNPVSAPPPSSSQEEAARSRLAVFARGDSGEKSNLSLAFISILIFACAFRNCMHRFKQISSILFHIFIDLGRSGGSFFKHSGSWDITFS